MNLEHNIVTSMIVQMLITLNWVRLRMQNGVSVSLFSCSKLGAQNTFSGLKRDAGSASEVRVVEREKVISKRQFKKSIKPTSWS
jgi:hypothetical protein